MSDKIDDPDMAAGVGNMPLPATPNERFNRSAEGQKYLHSMDNVVPLKESSNNNKRIL